MRLNASTWEEYLSELVSGHLTWSPPHESDEFWKDNANRLNENDGELLKCGSPCPLRP